jgi:hypothetical protein
MRTLDCNVDSCPVDCVLSDWFESASCSVTCGGGSRSEQRVVQVSAAYGGAVCSDDRSKDLECGTDPCPINCEFENWSGWEECTVTCGNGKRSRDRGEAVSAAHGGEACVGPTDEEEACNEFECPIDCDHSDWGDWGVCSEACGPGTHSRSRYEDPSAAYGGAACEGKLSEAQDCEVVPCPVDCVMGAWENEGECSSTCGGGYQQQFRDVTTAMAHGGSTCPAVEGNVAFLQGGHGATKAAEEGRQTRQIMCNTDPCPVDCELTAMTVDLSCSVSCGGGIEVHRASIATLNAHGGTECPAADSEQRYKEEACNEQECPVDCEMTQWTGFGACSETCGEGSKKRTREVTTEAAHGGVVCPDGREEVETCHVVACPINCELGQWSNWGDCSSECGPGSKTRARSVAIEAQYGGSSCDGALGEEADCEVAPCPVDCELDVWVDDEAGCSKTCGGGELKQTRAVKVAADHGGEECDAAVEQTVLCNEDSCPKDCVLSDWVESTECTITCGGGERTYIKNVVEAAAHGGVACPEAQDDEMLKTEACNEDACPVDCVLSPFGAWTDCSATCADGTRSKERTVETEAANGGTECEGDLKEEESCNLGECPIDCVLSDWEEWSECSISCGEVGYQVRFRNITTDQAHGGEACGDMFENRTECPDLVPCPIDCVLGAWEREECSVTCGDGTLKETRAIQTEPQHNGTACGAQEKTLPCGGEVCPVDCQVSEWEAVGTCTRACGGGFQTKRRYVMQAAVGTGAACPVAAELEEEEACNEHECPGEPVGEAGAQSMPMEGSGGEKVITLNVAHSSLPVIIAGPLPMRGDERVGLAVVSAVAKQETTVAAPADEVAPDRVTGCECTGGPSSAVPMGENNVQYPASYGDFCHAWTPRDPSAAEASADGPIELTYIGDGWAYNGASKMRVYVGSDIVEADQTVGEQVVFPQGSGVKIPDFPAEADAAWPADGEEWCYVANDAECTGKKSDGWAEWVYCGAAGPGWDTQPAPGYPEVTVCPFSGYDGATPVFTMLTTKYDAGTQDYCVGKMDHNDCHDPSSFGGMTVGLVSSVKMEDSMKMLKRTYHTTTKDTCLYVDDQKDAFCGSGYPDGTDLGYIFAGEKPGTIPMSHYFDNEHSCVGVEDDSCSGYGVPTKADFGYMMTEEAWDAWQQCGAQAATDLKWQVTLETKLEGSKADGAPSYEPVAWMALKQGVFRTSSGAVLQAGIAMIPADGEFHEIAFHQDFSAAPTVITQQVAPVDFVRAKEPETGKFWASADAGFEELELTGNCVDKYPAGEVSPCTPLTNQDECHANAKCAWNEIVVGKCRADNVVNYGACKAHMNDEAACTGAEGCSWSTNDEAHHGPPSVAVHWVAIDAGEGYLSSYPFVAGSEEMTSDPTTLEYTEAFTQTPLVFGSVATDRTAGEADLRVKMNAANATTLSLQGASTAEKASYLIYNGKGAAGSVFKATPVLVMNYSYHVSGWGECEAEGSQGRRTRTVECKGSNGKAYAAPFCTGTLPHSEENCQVTSFYMLHAESGRCLAPEATTASEGSEVHLESAGLALRTCTGEAGKLRLKAAEENGGFKVASMQTGRCLCLSGAEWRFSDCSAQDCAVTRTSLPDGTFTLSPAGSTSCLRGKPSSQTVKFYSNTYCSSTESQWAFVTEQTKIASYVSEPPLHAYYYYAFRDDDNTKLTDGVVMTDSFGDFPNAPWGGAVNETDITLTLAEPAPVQTVTIGFVVSAEDWAALPAQVEVSCNGGTPIQGVIPDAGSNAFGHYEVAANVGSECGADDVETVTIHVIGKHDNNWQGGDAMLDEVSVFTTADFGEDSVGAALFTHAKHHHKHHVHKPTHEPAKVVKKTTKKAKAQPSKKAAPKNDLGRVVKVRSRK